MPFLTGDSPAPLATMSFQFPNNDAIRRAITGSLSELCKAHNWEQWGDMTAEETAALCCDIVPVIGGGGSTLATLASLKLTTEPIAFAGAWLKPAYDVILSDADGLWNAANNWFDIPSDGLWLLSFSGYGSRNVNPAHTRAALFLDDSYVQELPPGAIVGNTPDDTLSLFAAFLATSGTTASIRFSASAGVSVIGYDNHDCFVILEKLYDA